MNKYQKTFHSTDGQEFSADVYSVLDAFGVTNPAVQHAVKKLLMPGQRGAKSELQDLDEALVSVCRAIDMARAKLTRNGTHTGETGPEPEPGPKPKLVTWRKCVRIQPHEIDDGNFYAEWYRSGDIPEDWYPIEFCVRPIETIKDLPEGQEP